MNSIPKDALWLRKKFASVREFVFVRPAYSSFASDGFCLVIGEASQMLKALAVLIDGICRIELQTFFVSSQCGIRILLDQDLGLERVYQFGSVNSFT